MQGNAYEWCHNIVMYRLLSSTGAVQLNRSDRAEVFPNQHRALRGGSYYNAARNVRSAYRYRYLPTLHTNTVGVRAAKTYP